MIYAGLGMIMSNVISLHCERCGVGNARSLNALSVEAQGWTPTQGLRHYATVARQASMTARSWIILWLLYIRCTAELGYVPLLPCGALFLPQNRSRPALSKHKSIVRPP
jgi:hypothetical protein